MLHRLPDRFQRGQPCRIGRNHPGLPLLGEAKRFRTAVPELHKFAPDRLGLPAARDKRRRLRVGCRVGAAFIRHVLQDVLPPRGEGLQPVLRPAGYLEARQAAHGCRGQIIPEVPQTPRQIVAIPRPEHAPVASQQRGFDAAPCAVPVARHVGEHRMGVELRVVVAARHVPEGRRDHPVRRLPGPSTRRGVIAPGLEIFGLNPVERRAHRRVMGLHHRPSAPKERFQRDRLRGRERHVPAGTVLALPINDAPQRDLRPRHLPRQDRDELPLADPLAKSEMLCAGPVPAVGRAVRVVVPRKVFVQEITEGLRGTHKGTRAGQH